MRIATWNVNGIRARADQFAEFVEEEHLDVICLQETKAPPEKVPEAIASLDGFDCHWHGSGGYSGVALMIRRELFNDEIEFFHPDLDFENRVVAAHIGDAFVASIYLPNGGKDFEAKLRFMRELEQLVEDELTRGHQVILCGDMNVTRGDIDVHPKERKPRAIGQLPIERDIFNGMIERHLTDLGRHFHPDDEEMFTWWAPWRNMRQRNIGWRLDYVLVSDQLASRARSCEVAREVGTSDHAPVIAEIDLTL